MLVKKLKVKTAMKERRHKRRASSRLVMLPLRGGIDTGGEYPLENEMLVLQRFAARLVPAGCASNLSRRSQFTQKTFTLQTTTPLCLWHLYAATALVYNIRLVLWVANDIECVHSVLGEILNKIHDMLHAPVITRN